MKNCTRNTNIALRIATVHVKNVQYFMPVHCWLIFLIRYGSWAYGNMPSCLNLLWTTRPIFADRRQQTAKIVLLILRNFQVPTRPTRVIRPTGFTEPGVRRPEGLVKHMAYWEVTPCTLDGYWRFRVPCCSMRNTVFLRVGFHLQNYTASQARIP